jgi:hypothetical protein
MLYYIFVSILFIISIITSVVINLINSITSFLRETPSLAETRNINNRTSTNYTHLDSIIMSVVPSKKETPPMVIIETVDVKESNIIDESIYAIVSKDYEINDVKFTVLSPEMIRNYFEMNSTKKIISSENRGIPIYNDINMYVLYNIFYKYPAMSNIEIQNYMMYSENVHVELFNNMFCIIYNTVDNHNNRYYSTLAYRASTVPNISNVGDVSTTMLNKYSVGTVIIEMCSKIIGKDKTVLALGAYVYMFSSRDDFIKAKYYLATVFAWYIKTKNKPITNFLKSKYFISLFHPYLVTLEEPAPAAPALAPALAPAPAPALATIAGSGYSQ